jgi:hypothetical protein
MQDRCHAFAVSSGSEEVLLHQTFKFQIRQALGELCGGMVKIEQILPAEPPPPAERSSHAGA